MPGIALALLASLALFDAACARSTTEEQLLTSFFRLARLRDNTALANIASVGFNPRTDGTVERFQIVSIGPEQGLSKQVTVDAQVRTPDGQTVPRTIVFTFETREGRWMITRLRVSQTSRAASSAPPY